MQSYAFEKDQSICHMRIFDLAESLFGKNNVKLISLITVLSWRETHLI